VLLGYFGEEAAPCGNCDTCLDPPQTWDGTQAARKFMSAALRTGQRFGAAHLIDLLLGRETDKMRQHGHERLPTFGVGTDLDEPAWRSVARQLVAAGLLHADAQRHGALVLTEAARPVLRGETALQLRRVRPRATQHKAARGKAPAGPAAADAPVFDRLRAWRRAAAEAQGVPPFVIFHDSTLHELARLRPRDLPDLAQVSGVGARKLERYGEELLRVLAEA
jgi:ATP-dependent DNA helicase RecQ